MVPEPVEVNLKAKVLDDIQQLQHKDQERRFKEEVS